MEQARILVVEDSKDLSSIIRRGLEEEGYFVGVADTAEIAYRLLNERWALIILDLMLPDADGESIMSFLAQRGDRPSVLVLSARGDVRDRISLFELGCDDYLTKPFAFEELLGRIKALLRRPIQTVSENLTYSDLVLDVENHALSRGKLSVSLTPKEFAICRHLMSVAERVVSRAELLRSVWGLTHEPNTNFIEVHLVHLRKKMGQIGRDNLLQNVRAAGFKLCAPLNREFSK